MAAALLLALAAPSAAAVQGIGDPAGPPADYLSTKGLALFERGF